MVNWFYTNYAIRRSVHVRTGWLYEPFGRVQVAAQTDPATDLRTHAGWPRAPEKGRLGAYGGYSYDGLARQGSAEEEDDPDDGTRHVDCGSSGSGQAELTDLRPSGIIRGSRARRPTPHQPPPAYHQLQYHLHHPFVAAQHQHHYRVVTFDERPLAPQLEMESVGHHVAVPLRVGGKKMRKRRELDALVAHSLAKGAKGGAGRHIASNGVASHDQLLSNSTDEQEDYSWQPKVRTQSRCRTKRFSCLRTCGPLLFVSCIFISLAFMYWLYFDIRQQISQYRIRIEQGRRPYEVVTVVKIKNNKHVVVDFLPSLAVWLLRDREIAFRFWDNGKNFSR
ncbi:hypothetical protein ZHAS_00016891 [Anopheles sinensis]|uniref:Uncharacterized protein n=1 Tax=Anopheles sinensis TaxID=74873 RepID=A0A084WED3_ANOSI|nr:hypothetical protein ZHAS_00016891 [Anopheles sinensis]